MGYMVLAYSIAWILIFGYVLVIGKKHANLQKEIDFLKQLD